MTKKIKKGKSLVVQNKVIMEVPRKNQELKWGGVIPHNSDDRNEKQVADFCNQVAVIYGVPSIGVNAMGGNPYLNKDGRLFLLAKYKTGKQGVKAIRSVPLQMSLTPTETAIYKTTIYFKDGVEVEAIGEASKANINPKMTQVYNSLNMMAETRATNRAIWKAIAFDVWSGIAENLEKAKLTAEEKAKIINAGKVSAEEMSMPEPKDVFPTGTPDEELINQLKEKVDATDDVAMLMDYAVKLQNSKSPKKVKDEVAKYIQNKVATLS